MTVLIISIVAAWIIFSALLVTIICVNSARLSRIDEPFKDPAHIEQERLRRNEEFSQEAYQLTAE
ncbi:MAG: hypothetical protein JSV42_00675 [Chloroflexota bacterium]|nr:MAG: hypothetical protein JSV42_00675 [Chloroflexota bacterium]